MEARTAGRHDGSTDVVGGASARETLIRAPEAVADPAPLGLAAFALTTFVLSFFNADLVSN